MMKKGLFKNIGVLAVVLSLVTVTMLSGTLAKYTGAITGTGQGTVAKWSFTPKVGGQASTANFDLVQSKFTGVADDGAKAMMAPGVSGKFEMALNFDSDVDATITTVVAKDGTGKELDTANIRFAIMDTDTAPTEEGDSGYTLKWSGLSEALSAKWAAGESEGTATGITIGETNKNVLTVANNATVINKTVYVYWKWVDNDTLTNGIPADATIGTAAAATDANANAYKLVITMKAEQIAPKPSTTGV